MTSLLHHLTGHDHARQRYCEALTLYSSIPDVLGQANCLLGLGQLALGRRYYTDAREHFLRSAELYKRLGSPKEARCLQSLAGLAASRGDYGAATSAARQSLSVVENVRGSLRSAFSRMEHHERWQIVYTTGIRVFLDAGNIEEAVTTLGALQGRLFFEEANHSAHRTDPWDSLPAHLLTPELAPDQLAAVSAAGRGRRLLRRVGRQLRLHETEVARAEAHRYRQAEFVASMARGASPAAPTYDALQAEVDARRNTTVVAFAWTDEIHAIFLLRPFERPLVLDFDREQTETVAQVAQALEHLTGLISNLTATTQQTRRTATDWDTTFKQLRQHLWDPVRRLVQTPEVRVVSCGKLGYVPFARIEPSAPDALIVSMVPSLGLLISTPVAAPATESKEVFAVGVDAIKALPGVELSLDLVESSIPPDLRTVLRIADDPKATMLGLTGSYRVALLFAHMQSTQPNIPAAIQLAAINASGEVTSTRLSLFEILNLQMRADLVVLCGCWSAAHSDSWELQSLAAAAMVGLKAETVIAAHYPVTHVGALTVWAEVLASLLDDKRVDAALLRRILDASALLQPRDVPEYVRSLATRFRLPVSLAQELERVVRSTARPESAAEPLLLPSDVAAWATFAR